MKRTYKSKSKGGLTHEVSITYFSFLDLIAPWTVEITLDMYDRLEEAGPCTEGFLKGFAIFQIGCSSNSIRMGGPNRWFWS